MRRAGLDRSRLSTFAFVAFLASCTARILSVDVAGIVNNDSLTYLRESRDPFVDGFVFQGYRQVGYSLVIALSNLGGDVVGWDRVFGVAMLQRFVLVVALMLLAWSLRWWSAPVLVFATSASFVVLADHILVEGLLIPLCLGMGGMLAMVVVGRVSTPRLGRGVTIAACALAAICAGLKLQYAVLMAVAGAIAWLLRSDGLVTRRCALVALTSATLFIGLLTVAQSVENRSDLGVLEPIGERHRSAWWGAWMTVFVIHPENVDDPALAVYYDDGSLYTFLHGIEREEPNYVRRRAIVEARNRSMLDAAGMSRRGEQFSALLGALRGGRFDDLASLTNRVLSADPGDPLVRLQPNAVYQQDGVEAVIRGYNDGLRPGIVTTGPIFDFSQRIFDHYGVWRSRVSVAVLVIMGAGLVVRGRHRAAAAAAMVVMFAVAGAMASGLTDNARYLVGPLIIGMIAAVLSLRALADSPLAHAAWDRAITIVVGARRPPAGDRISSRHARSPGAAGTR